MERRRGAVFVGVGAFVVLAILSLAPMAFAQAPPSTPTEQQLAEARRWFFDAVDAQDKGKYRDALEVYERVRAVKVSPTLLFNIGACHERLDELIEAAEAFEQAVEEAKTHLAAEVEAESRARLTAMREEIPLVRIRLPQGINDASAMLDDHELDVAKLSGDLKLNPGTHRLVVRSESRIRVFAITIDLPRRARRAVDVDLGPVRGAPEKLVVLTPGKPAKVNAPALIAGGAALAFGGGALATGLIGHDQHERFDDLNAKPSIDNRPERERLHDSGQTMYVLNAGLIVATAVALGAAVYFVVRSPPAKTAQQTATCAGQWRF